MYMIQPCQGMDAELRNLKMLNSICVILIPQVVGTVMITEDILAVTVEVPEEATVEALKAAVNKLARNLAVGALARIIHQRADFGVADVA